MLYATIGVGLGSRLKIRKVAMPGILELVHEKVARVRAAGLCNFAAPL